ncbi:hypothetical protein GGI25_003837 [Coemansia spiralis]|uniref:Complex 1 LYR protein domain-containing protein n=2 Tax=Coemansia TaxID=4863 RepID=A0A9W8G5X4_9FUNG|nr:hypothetical protein BX070DRAFT_234682 [Coemansia spiralis]KAJ1990984.1 hypothetical protein EDC05_003704 [Coemansia umbellata]KAJ2620994.1 hypothetical protein GGI26_004494 [Coemansia sp. RSA 1358]KAJ2675743.1 hypothetical protein GGI25_003837 [Coemansia spiralis]
MAGYIFRPKQPFFRQLWHRQRILSTYRKLLRQAKQFSDPVEKTYLWSWIRERFHHNKRQTSPRQVDSQLSDAMWTQLVMASALSGGCGQEKKLIGDLAYGRRGWLKDVMVEIGRFNHPTKACQLIRDVRPRSSKIHQPHRAYWIPLDLRAFSVPPGMLQRIREEDEAARRHKRRKRERRERRLGREIQAMTNAINNGNTALRESGLLRDAFSYEPSVMYSDCYIPGVVGNPAWLPPRIEAQEDPPVVQHVRTSIGYEFLRINARKPPHWLGARIAAEYRAVTKRLLKHEFYFYMIRDLQLEEEFEARLGVEDPGYWVFARNYREYLRYKIKTFTVPPGEDVRDKGVLRMLETGREAYHRAEDFAAEHMADDQLP